MRINLSTRILHISMIITVLYQLLSSLWMVVPEPGKLLSYKTTLFFLHISLFGWLAFILSGVYAWTRLHESDSWGRLVPWFSAERRAAFFRSAIKELPGIFTGRLAPPEDNGALAGAVHGLGFLLLICLGLTGIYLSLGVRADGTMRDDILLFLDFHEFFGTMIWIFLGAHVVMTIYHLILGNHRILDIFQRGRIPWS